MSGFSSKENGSSFFKGKSLSEIKSWYQDRYESIVVQRNALFIITVIALVGLGFSVASVATLNASKIFEPFLIEVEERSGIVTQINRNELEEYTAREEVIRYFLAKYMQARESYNADDYQHFYFQVVRLLSSRTSYRQFRRGIDVTNKDSPLILASNASREVEIKSMSRLEPKKWQVRYAVKEYKMPDYVLRDTQHYIATINFDFLRLDLSEHERYINPLDFQVQSFRRDKEQVK